MPPTSSLPAPFYLNSEIKDKRRWSAPTTLRSRPSASGRPTARLRLGARLAPRPSFDLFEHSVLYFNRSKLRKRANVVRHAQFNYDQYMKQIILVCFLFLLSGCANAEYETRGDRLIMKFWKLTYFSKGFDGGVESYYPQYPTLNECKNQGSKLLQEKIAENPDADYFCGTNCIVVKDGIEPRHCDKGVAAKCSNGKCEFITNPKIQHGSIIVD